MRTRAEIELITLAVAYGMNQNMVESLVDEIKQDAVESDNAFEQEVSNLRNAKDEAVKALQQVLYNLRNA